MDHLQETVCRLVSLAGSYQPGVIHEAEQVVDSYLAASRGYPTRRAAIDALLSELASPTNRAFNRGGLFEQVELHVQRRHREMTRLFQ